MLFLQERSDNKYYNYIIFSASYSATASSLRVSESVTNKSV